MKTSNLQIGGKYELKTGHITTIKGISGQGRDRQVFVDCMLKWSHRPAGRYVPIAVFAALVVRKGSKGASRVDRDRQLKSCGCQISERTGDVEDVT